MTELLTLLKGRHTIYNRKNSDSEIINIPNCTTRNNLPLVVECVIFIRCHYQTVRTWAISESTDQSDGRPADHLPNFDVWGNVQYTVPELMVWDQWQPRQPIWQQFRLDLDLDSMWWSGTIANTKQYPNWKFRCNHNLEHQLGNSTVMAPTPTRSDGPELLLMLMILAKPQFYSFPIRLISSNCVGSWLYGLICYTFCCEAVVVYADVIIY